MKICDSCDTRYDDYLNACPKCGNPYVTADTVNNAVNKYNIRGASATTTYTQKSTLNSVDNGTFAGGVCLTLFLGVLGMFICLAFTKIDTCRGGALGAIINFIIAIVLYAIF